ncbi:carbohydrate sulfotransferase 11-like isoform X2 [Hyperolius riggenbachi]|uniref:carbohydrate sulfotransferase 11-like isoform X2 n=1 Tax=Hyperolius riggenbachi TaxID=752182 RepID=UPI0035A2AB8E
MRFLLRVSMLLLGVVLIYFRMKMMSLTPNQEASTMVENTKEDERKTLSITTDSFLHVQQLRKTKLRKFCHQFPELSSLKGSEMADQLLSTLAVSHKLLMVYCKSSNLVMDGWEDMIRALEDRVDVTIRSPLVDDQVPKVFSDKLTDYNASIFKHILRTFTKVLFVRDPFEGLVSTYMEGHAGDILFDEFIDYTLMEEVGDDGLSASSVVSLCHPCFIKYDYIVMYDFLRAELYHLVRRLDLPGGPHLSHSPGGQSRMTTRWLAENLFRGLSNHQISQLSEAYWCDFAAFPLHNSLLWNSSFDMIS